MTSTVNRLALILFGTAVTASITPADDVFLFTSFRGNGDGLHYAWSEDGKTWSEIPGVFLDPAVGGGLMRDPDIERGPDGTYHLVWTSGWGENGIGYASSDDLHTWTEPRFLPFMQSAEGTRNSWAPELFYDEAGNGGAGQFLITWSSDVEGRFPETRSNDRMNNRTYFVTTTDFETFSEPEVLVEPGFDHIDFTMTRDGDRYVAVIKEGDMQGRGVWGPIHRLEADSATGPWTLVGEPIITERAEGPALARAGGETLLYVDFYTQGRYGAYATTDWNTWRDISNEVRTIDGQRHGSILTVPRALVEDLIEGPRLEPVTLRVNTAAGGTPISEHLVGVFFEDINHAADGGLYAELVRNRSFEFNATERSDWNAMTGWEMATHGGGGWPVIDEGEPIHPNNPRYVVVHATNVRGPGVGLVNGGFDGIAVEAGQQYRFSVFARQLYMGGRWDGDNSLEGRPMPLLARLQTGSGEVLGEARVDVAGRDWTRYEATITATRTDADARLAVLLTERGGAAMDMVSLFPAETFKGRRNGLRTDLARVIADLEPAFVRFPGGCLVHGDGLHNIYRWQDTVGPVEQRRGQKNIWGYHQSVGLGYFEYFRFCEDIGAFPVPVVAAGVCCQNAGQVGGIGQRGFPMADMPAYIEDVLNLIEWANGTADSEWGRVRAEAGHPEPFGLKYLGVGNEDHITPMFRQRFELIRDAIKAEHPEIVVIGTVGPFHSGPDYENGWAIARELGLEMVDEHYYVSPDWFWENLDYYDGYDRDGARVYLGEYAAHDEGRRTTLRSALAEAAYLTALERNADLVEMASYAPLLGKAGRTQWNPDLIYFDNTRVAPTINYEVQRLFSLHGGIALLDTGTTGVSQGASSRLAWSAVRDGETGDVILKIVNGRSGTRPVTVALEGLAGERRATAIVLADADPTAVNSIDTPDRVTPTERPIEAGPSFDYAAPPYSLTVIRIPG